MMFLARHGETEWNVAGRMQGRRGGPLTARGRAQAAALGAAARALGVRRVISSPLPRALETAAATGLQPAVCDALVEIDFGDCTGLTEAEIQARHPGLRAERDRNKWHHRWPGGESYADVARRLAPALADLAGPDTLVVAHQALNRVMAYLVAGLDRPDALALAQRSDVLLRFYPDAHARMTDLVWRPGLRDSA